MKDVEDRKASAKRYYRALVYMAKRGGGGEAQAQAETTATQTHNTI